MHLVQLAAALLLATGLSACQNTSDQLGDIGSSFQGGLGRDTMGSNRRMDVYGGATAPSMPTISARGYGR